MRSPAVHWPARIPAALLLTLTLGCATASKVPQVAQSLPEESRLPAPPAIEPPAPPPVAPSAAPAPAPVPEARSLGGKALFPPTLAPEIQKKREEDLAAARAELDKNRDSAEAMIWVGRRLGYLGRYKEAIAMFSLGLRKFPADARFYRHRGHRYITVREFGHAVADLTEGMRLMKGKRDQVEQDGLPNQRNIPTTTLKSNLCYHLGLAYYLRGDFDKALRVYRPCLKEASSPDRIVSTAHWLYATLRRLGREREAASVLEPIGMDMDVIENVSYYKLLMMYEGEITPEELQRERGGDNDPATIGYGIGNWYLYNGQTARAMETFRKIVEGPRWDSFGFIAAEAELTRN